MPNAMARRKVIKDFLACLWIVYRQAKGLPVSQAHVSGIVLDPWQMVDK